MRIAVVLLTVFAVVFLATGCIFKTVTLTMLEPENGGEVQPLPGVHNYLTGTVVSIEATPGDNWDFDRWEVDGGFYSSEEATTLKMDSEKVVKAFFVRKPVTLTMLEPSGQGDVDPDPGMLSFEYGAVVDLSATPTKGWEFDRWQVNGAFYSSAESTTLTMDNDKTVKAFFNEEPVASVTLYMLEPIGQGEIQPLEGDHEYNAGTVVTLKATPSEGWLFDHWLVEGALYSGDKEAHLTMNTDRNVKAVFVRKTYTLTMLQTSGSGSVEPPVGSHVYEEGTEVMLVASPANGWEFDYWQIDGVVVTGNPEHKVTMDANKTARAFFVEEPPVVFTLTMMEPSGQGSVSPPVGNHTYIEGTLVSLTATPEEGWEFESWHVDGVNFSNVANVTIVMDRNKSVSASFVKKAEKVILEIYKSGRGTVSPPEGMYEYDKGSSVDLSATPASGYHFEEWLVDGTTYLVQNITITLEWDTVAIATFRCNCGGEGQE